MRFLQRTTTLFRSMSSGVSSVAVEKKSKFQGRCFPLKNGSEVAGILETLDADKKIAKATHKYMYAWKCGNQMGSNDCGEAGAAQRLTTLLEHGGYDNVMVVVTRWYGGTPLGGARFRLITTVAAEALKDGGFHSKGKK